MIGLNDLLNSNRVTDICTNLSQLTNGIDYVFVEVTCDDGSQYGLQAYGIEALDLHMRVLEISEKQKEEVLVSYTNSNASAAHTLES